VCAIQLNRLQNYVQTALLPWSVTQIGSPTYLKDDSHSLAKNDIFYLKENVARLVGGSNSVDSCLSQSFYFYYYYYYYYYYY
jgi:hypothetical protein